MDSSVLVAIVGTAGVVVGAVIGYLKARHVGKAKVRELELTYQHRLHDSYLENARRYTEGVYVPLTLLLSSLRSAFDGFRQRTTPLVERPSDAPIDLPNSPLAEFKRCAQTFLDRTSDLLERGAGAFLTTVLELRLASFRGFLQTSLNTTEPVVRAVLKYRIGIFGLRAEHQFSSELRGSAVRRWGSRPVAIVLFGASIEYHANELLAAPLGSQEFEARLQRDLGDLNALIKEVTLGAHATRDGSSIT